jgi:hypothetical protein
MLLDEGGTPLAMVVNAQPFAMEMCSACQVIYPAAEARRLAKRCQKCGALHAARTMRCECGARTLDRVCGCGRWDAWISHFACFPQRIVEPCLLLGTSAHGACHRCGAPYERVLDRPAGAGDWNTDPAHKHATGCVASIAKRSRREEKIEPDGTQHSASRLLQNTYEARAAGKHAIADPGRAGDPPNTMAAASRHDNPWPSPMTLGWRPTCSHPLFPAAPVPCTVLDPFSGSGRTGLAALQLGLDYIGIELNPHYAAMSRYQLDALVEKLRGTSQQPVSGTASSRDGSNAKTLTAERTASA